MILTIGHPFPSSVGGSSEANAYYSCSNNKIMFYSLSNLSQGLPTNECNQSAEGTEAPCVTTVASGSCWPNEDGTSSVKSIKYTFNDEVCPGGDVSVVHLPVTLRRESTRQQPSI